MFSIVIIRNFAPYPKTRCSDSSYKKPLRERIKKSLRTKK